MKLLLDIETRSTVDLRKSGQYVYAAHPQTEILMVAWAIDGGPVRVWFPAQFPDVDMLAAMTDPDCRLVAHNASFERVLLTGPAGRRILRNEADAMVPLSRWDCTAARAASMGLPRTLEGAAAALGLPVEKDKEGAALMLRMCKPKPGSDMRAPVYFDDPERMQRLAAYCAQDVEVERQIDKALPPLPASERAVWELTETMNDRGVRVDSDLLLRVSLLIEDAERDVNGRLAEATGGAVRRVSDHMALTRWLDAQGVYDGPEPFTPTPDGAVIRSVGKAAISAMLERDGLPSLVRQVLIMRQEGGKSSASKYRAILARLSDDSRLRGALVYCGAAATGRWSSRGAQLQNLPRGGSVKNVDGAIRDLLDGATLGELEELHGPPLVLASELLRPVFTATAETWLARGDYSQIEARVLAWLAGQDNVLDAFRAYDAGTGPDLYKVTASGIYGVSVADVSKDQRQIGKVAALALGYQGGKGAFQAMARGYGVKVSDERAEEIKAAWRGTNPAIVNFWRVLETTAADCVAAPAGRDWLPVGKHGLAFRRNAQVMALRLPSKRCLIYWNPRLEKVETSWGEMKWAVTYRAEDSQTKRWAKFAAYGGLWCENATQATARDLMADALLRMEAAGLAPTLTVHDEGVCEVPRSMAPTAADAANLAEGIMRQTPAWAAGLPVAADASAAARYVKG